MKLKTLNKLVKEADELSFGGYTVDTLKEEAIRWIKSDDWQKAGFDLGYDMNIDEAKAMIAWIKHFFDLTDDDLK